MPLLEIRDLEIRFGARASSTAAVREINLNIEEGEVLGLVGESGSGKSATALAIMGLLGAAAQVTGRMMWQSAAGAGNPAIDLVQQPQRELRKLRGREIGMIFQEPMTALNPV